LYSPIRKAILSETTLFPFGRRGNVNEWKQDCNLHDL
jgi:hypothetical protein